jgi:hypothetical protein
MSSTIVTANLLKNLSSTLVCYIEVNGNAGWEIDPGVYVITRV